MQIICKIIINKNGGKEMKKHMAKKLLSFALAAALLIGCVPASLVSATGGDTLMQDVGFNESAVVLRLAAVSDQHTSYSAYSAEAIAGKAQKYADLVAAIDDLSGHKLDAIMSMGDYTSTGSSVQGATFASVTKAILDAINADKPGDEKTRFLYCYGNHDTSWGGNMAISESSADFASISSGSLNKDAHGNEITWESLMNEYGLLSAQGAIIDDGMEGQGCYTYALETASGTYYVLSLETDKYTGSSNIYSNKALSWLDAKLAEITALDGSKYIYIMSHAPIKESDVYGANIELEKNAGWAACDADENGRMGALDDVLKKYPQAVYISGHTHFANFLDSTVMSKNYTAITLSALTGDLFTSASPYLVDDYGTNTTMGLLIEFDANGNQRIRRVVSTGNSNISVSGDTATGVEGCMLPLTMKLKSGIANTSKASGEPATISAVEVTASRMDYSGHSWYVYGEPWTSPTPSGDGSHLVALSSARGAASDIGFSEGAEVKALGYSYNKTSGKLTSSVYFPAASTDDGTKILYYSIVTYDGKGKAIDERWAFGNYFAKTGGVAEGTSHLDATAFRYALPETALSTDSFSIGVTAVDEYGNRSEEISTGELSVSGIVEMPEIGTLENHFDTYSRGAINATPVRPITLTYAANGGTESSGAMASCNGYITPGNIKSVFFNNTVANGGTAWSKVNLITNPTEISKYTNAQVGEWGANYLRPTMFTRFSATDSFVFETDMQFGSTAGNIQFVLRHENGVSTNDSIFTGIKFSSAGTEILLNNKTVASSGIYKVSDTAVHHVTVLSTPLYITIWVDGVCVISNVMLASSFSSSMIPVMSFSATSCDITLSSFKLYEYSPAAPAYDITHRDLFATCAGAMSGVYTGTVNASFNGSDTTFTNATNAEASGNGTLASFFLNKKKYEEYRDYATGSLWGNNLSKAASFTGLSPDVTFVYEADFNVSKLESGARLTFNFRNNSTFKQVNGVSLTSSGTGLFLSEGADRQIATSNKFALSADAVDHHIIILSSPEKVSVWIDGRCIFDDLDYKATVDLIPNIYLLDGKADATVKNQKLWLTDEPDVEPDTLGAVRRNYIDGATFYTSAAISRYVDGFRANNQNNSMWYTSIYLATGDKSAMKQGHEGSRSQHDFADTDQVIWETDYTVNSLLVPASGAINDDCYFYFRSDGTNSISLLLRTNVSSAGAKSPQIYLFVNGTAKPMTPRNGYLGVNSTDFMKPGHNYHLKIVSDNTKCSIYIDGFTVCENYAYTSVLSSYKSAGYIPCFSLAPRAADWDFFGMKIFKAQNGEAIDENTEGIRIDTAENLIYSEAYVPYNTFGTVNDFTVSGDDIYLNMFWTNLQRHGSSSFYSGAVTYPFGSNDTKFTFDPDKSYVFTFDVRKMNSAADNGNKYSSRVGFDVGVYNGNSIWTFADDGTYNIYHSAGGKDTKYSGVNIKNLTDRYYRYTLAFGPYGYDIYVDGNRVGGETFENASLFTPRPTFRVNGSEVFIRNVGFYENTDEFAQRYCLITELESALSFGESCVAQPHRISGDADENAVIGEAVAVLSAWSQNRQSVSYDRIRNAIDGIYTLTEAMTFTNNYFLDGECVPNALVGNPALTVTRDGYVFSLNRDGYAAMKETNLQTHKEVRYSGFAPLADDSYFVEYDVKVSDIIDADANGTRIMFSPGTINGVTLYTMIQNKIFYTSTPTGGWTSVGSTGNVSSADTVNTIHVRFTVKNGKTVRSELTAGAASYSYDWNLESTFGSGYTLVPCVSSYFKRAIYTVSDLRVGYILEDYDKILKELIDECSALDMDDYSHESAAVFTEALDTASTVHGCYADCRKSEICDAGSALVDAKAALKKGKYVEIGVLGGDGDANTYFAEEGKELPVDIRVGTKFVHGWVNNKTGEAVTVYNGEEDICAEYVETGMMKVKFQFKPENPTDGKVSMRLIASVDTLDDYSVTGWIFSLTESDPEKGMDGVKYRETQSVYNAVIANGERLTAKDVYKNSSYIDSSNYLFCYDITNIPSTAWDSPIYVRAYVTLTDGTVVYGDTKAIILANYIHD